MEYYKSTNLKYKQIFKMLFILFILINFLSFNVSAGNMLDTKHLDDFSFSEGEVDGDADMKFQVKESVDDSDFWNIIYREYRGIITGISGVITLSFTVFFIRNVVSMSVNSDNPVARKKASTGILWTGIGLALTSALTIVLSLVFYVF